MEPTDNSTKKNNLEDLSKEEILEKYHTALSILKKAKQAKDVIVKENLGLKEQLAQVEKHKTATDEIIENLTHQKLHSVTSLEDLKLENKVLNEKLSACEVNLFEAESKISQLDTASQSYKRQVNRLTDENEQLITHLDSLERKIEELKEVGIQQQEQLLVLEKANSDLMKLNSSSCSDKSSHSIKSSNGRKASNEDKFFNEEKSNNEEKAFTEIEWEHAQSQILELQKMLNVSLSELKNLKSELGMKDEKIENLVMVCTQKDLNIVTIGTELTENKKEIESLKLTLNEKNTHCDLLTQKLEEASLKLAQLTKKFEESEKMFQIRQKEVEEQNESKHNVMDDLKTEMHKNRALIEKLKQDLKTTNEKLNDSQIVSSGVTTDLENINDKLKEKLKLYHGKMVKFANDIKALKETKNILLSNCRSYTEQVEEWKKQLNVLSEKLIQNVNECELEKNELQKVNEKLKEELGEFKEKLIGQVIQEDKKDNIQGERKMQSKSKIQGGVQEDERMQKEVESIQGERIENDKIQEEEKTQQDIINELDRIKEENKIKDEKIRELTSIKEGTIKEKCDFILQLETKEHEIKKLQISLSDLKEKLEKRSRNLSQKESEIEQLVESYSNLVESNEKLIKSSEMLVEKNNEITETNEKYAKEISRHLEEIKLKDDRIEELNAIILEPSSNISELNESIAELKERITGLEKHISGLEERNSDLEKDNLGLEKHNLELEKQKSELEESKSELEKNKSDLEIEKSDSEKQKSDLEEQKSNLEKQKSDLEKQKSDFEKQKSDLEKQKSDLEIQKSDLEKQKSDLEKQKSDLELQKSDLEFQKSNFEKQNSDLGKQNFDFVDQSSNLESNLGDKECFKEDTNKFEDKISLLTRENQELLSEMNEMNQAIKERGETISKQQVYCEELLKKIQLFESQCTKQTETLSEKEILMTGLQNEIMALKDKTLKTKELGDEDNSDCKKKDEHIMQLENFVAQMQTQVTQLQAELLTLKDTLNSNQYKDKQDKDKFSNLNESPHDCSYAESETMSTSTVSRLDEMNRLKDLEGPWEERYSKLRSLAIKQKGKIRDLTSDLNKEQAEKIELQQKLGNSLKNIQFLQAQCDKLQDELDVCKKECSSYIKKLDTIAIDIGKDKKVLAENEETIVKLKAEMENLIKEKSTTDNWKKQVSLKVQSLKKELAANTVMRKDFENQIKHLNLEIETKDKAWKSEIEKHNHTRSSLFESNNECKKQTVLNLEMQDYERSIKDLSQKLEKKQDLVNKLKNQLDSQKCNMNSIKEQNRLFEEQIETGEKELDGAKLEINLLKTKLGEFDASLLEKDGTIQSLMENLENVRAENEELSTQLSTIVAEHQKTNNLLKGEKEHLRSQNLGLEQRLREIEDSMRLKEDELSNVQNEYKGYKVRAQSVLRQNQTRDIGLEEKLTEEAESLKAQVEILNSEIEDLKTTKDKFKKDNENLASEREKIEVDCLELKAELEECKIQFEHLSNKYQQVIVEHAETVRSLKIHAETLSQCYRQQVSEQEVRHNREIIELQSKIAKTSSSPEIPPLLMPSMPREEGEGSESIESSSNSIHPIPLERLLSVSTDQETSFLKKHLSENESKVAHLTALLADTEQDLVKHVQMNKLLKEEIRRQQRSVEREQHAENLEYLKNVIFKFVTLNNGDERTRLVPVLTTILKLSPEETQKLNLVAKSDKGWSNYLPLWSASGSKPQ